MTYEYMKFYKYLTCASKRIENTILMYRGQKSIRKNYIKKIDGKQTAGMLMHRHTHYFCIVPLNWRSYKIVSGHAS